MVALACMIAAGASHWWSVKQLVELFDAPEHVSRAMANKARQAEPVVTTNDKEGTVKKPEIAAAPAPATVLPAGNAAHAAIPTETAAMQEFYQELIREMQHLRTQNRDLLNQVAETNRDLMKLEFRVDTHSEQFRPLPVAEDNFGTTFDTSFDDSPGLLPLRAEPVALPYAE